MSVWTAALLSVAVTGCSSFEKNWTAAVAEKIDRGNPAGRWEGHWSSDVTGHRGPVRCMVTHAAEGKYQARFRARYAIVLTTEREVELDASQRGGLWHFSGEENLGLLAGGRHAYRGKASANQLFVTYESARDRGTLELERPN